MAQPRYCPNCAAVIPQGSPRNLCPQCLLRGVLEDDSGDRRGNGNGRGTGTRPSVLESIADTIGSVPRVLLRDTGPGEEPGPIVRPQESDGADATIRYRIDGEIARGGMGAVLKGATPIWVATWRSRSFAKTIAKMPTWSAGLSRRPRSAASSSIPASCRFTSWALSRTAGLSSP